MLVSCIVKSRLYILRKFLVAAWVPSRSCQCQATKAVEHELPLCLRHPAFSSSVSGQRPLKHHNLLTICIVGSARTPSQDIEGVCLYRAAAIAVLPPPQSRRVHVGMSVFCDGYLGECVGNAGEQEKVRGLDRRVSHRRSWRSV